MRAQLYNEPPLTVSPARLLIYRAEGNELQLARTGTHADLFGM